VETPLNAETKRAVLLRRAERYVKDHRSQFDPKDPGSFWGDALCDILGGADYLKFAQMMTGDAVIFAVPVFGEPVDAQQFTIEQLGTDVAAAGELHEVASTSTNGIEVGTENWIVNAAARALSALRTSDATLAGSPPGLERVLLITAFWLVNTPGGLLDLTGIKRPW
jgi:hypothetical protein